jgi:hypothetical protein
MLQQCKTTSGMQHVALLPYDDKMILTDVNDRACLCGSATTLRQCPQYLLQGISLT